MPTFNPAEPATDSYQESAPVRDNFNALKELLDAQAVQIAALQAQVTALEAAVAAKADKPVALSPLSYGASDPPAQGEVQGGFDLLATLITTLNA